MSTGDRQGPPRTQPRVLGGRYQLDSVLGRGGMAEVYLGTDRVLGRRVAVKVLSAQYARDTSFVTRFRREAQAAAALNHPNVVSVYDTGTDDGIHFIVLEYIEGRTLADIIRQDATIMPDRAVEIAESVASGLSFAHRNGIVHRDVKPANVMLAPSGDVKVTDFGIARATASESLTQTATVLGTAAYFSPEQAEGRTVDARSDIYSLGCVMYEMLTGRAPFTGDTPLAVAYKHVREDPVPPSRRNGDVPARLDAIVIKCMAKNPLNRYQTAEELRDDLRRYREGQPVRATPLLDGEPTGYVPPAHEAPRTEAIRRTRSHVPPTTTLPRAPEYEGRGSERRWAIAAVLVMILLILGVGLFLLAQSLLQGEDAVRVPDVVGDQLAAAQDRLQDVGFDSEVAAREESDEPVNEVLAYEPTEGVPGEDVVMLTVSAGQTIQMVPVPNVVCLPLDQARTILEGDGFVVRDGGEEENDECEGGSVARTEPEAGTEAEEGSEVTVFRTPQEEAPAPPSAPNLAAGSDSGSSNEDNVTNQTSLTFNGTADPSVTVTLFRDGAQVGSTTADGGGNWSVNDGGVPEGSHEYTARAANEDGDTSELSGSTAVVVDTTAPDTEITEAPPSPTTDTAATFEFASEDGVAFECSLDGGGFESCSSPQEYPGPLDIGVHTFDVRATDPAGNVEDSPAHHEWEITA